MKKISQNYLDMVPLRNVKEFLDEEGRVTLLIPKFKSEWMRKWLIPAKRSKHFRIHLDETGSEVWRLIDGNRNVGEMCALLTEAKEMENNKGIESDVRITNFLSQLFKNRFIIFK